LVELRLSYTDESNLKYYGLGNAANLLSGTGLADPLYEYRRVHPEARLRIRQHLVGSLFSELKVAYAYNRVDVREGTLLDMDANAASSSVEHLVRYDKEHSALGFGYGLAVDLRDDEVVTRRGQYYAIRLDLFPGGTDAVPYRYARLNANLRWFVPLWNRDSTLGLRLVADGLFGNAPIYELARYDDTSALGGPKGVRGIPAQRYHGRAKTFMNVQLRQVLFDFELLGKTNQLAIAMFCDMGRVWADYGARPDLDGRSLGLKWGVGAGPHLIAGKSFVIRADVAWSPDADPIAAYLAAGEIF
jgi:outer membrane protein assembly factor BamA